MTAEDIPFDRSISARPGAVQVVSPLVRRVIANNGGPFTFTGTCTYIVGAADATIVDPGPNDPAHLRTLLDALQGTRLRHILVTHTHRDHSAGAPALKAATGAPILGCRPRPPAAPGQGGPALDAGFDTGYAPDNVLGEGEGVDGPGYALVAVETPGHTSDHLAFALATEDALFSGDHVMAWSTSVVVPPDGSMRDYMASLRKLLARGDGLLWPGHGGPVRAPRSFVNALLVHRQWREAAILRCLRDGDITIGTIVSRLYRDLAPALKGAAGQSVLAHLVDLIERGLVSADGPPTVRTRYRPAA